MIGMCGYRSVSTDVLVVVIIILSVLVLCDRLATRQLLRAR